MTTDRHQIIVCTTCREKGSDLRPGKDILAKLEVDLKNQPDLEARYDVAGIECMAGCARSCTVAFRAEGKATYLFGDMTPEEDIDDLIAFARQYSELPDGWCISRDRPGKLRRTALARIPALNVPEAGAKAKAEAGAGAGAGADKP